MIIFSQIQIFCHRMTEYVRGEVVCFSFIISFITKKAGQEIRRNNRQRRTDRIDKEVCSHIVLFLPLSYVVSNLMCVIHSRKMADSLSLSCKIYSKNVLVGVTYYCINIYLSSRFNCRQSISKQIFVLIHALLKTIRIRVVEAASQTERRTNHSSLSKFMHAVAAEVKSCFSERRRQRRRKTAIVVRRRCQWSCWHIREYVVVAENHFVRCILFFLVARQTRSLITTRVISAKSLVS